MLELLHLELLLVELVDSGCVDFIIVIRLIKHGARVLLDPQILVWLEIVSEYRDDLLDLIVSVLVNEEVKRFLFQGLVVPIFGIGSFASLYDPLLRSVGYHVAHRILWNVAFSFHK